jgi:hypothetical protein
LVVDFAARQLGRSVRERSGLDAPRQARGTYVAGETRNAKRETRNGERGT